MVITPEIKPHFAHIIRMIFDFLASIQLMAKVRQILMMPIYEHCQDNYHSKIGCQFKALNFRARIDIVLLNSTFQLYMHVSEHASNPIFTQTIQRYFNQRVARCYQNYKIIKGFLCMIFTDLYQLLSVPEMIHFEIGIVQSKFLFAHGNQEELDRMAINMRLNIELMLEHFDFNDGGKYLAVKFIDPVSKVFKIIRFVKEPDQQVLQPDPPLMNIEYNQKIRQNTQSFMKFLTKVVLMMTLKIEELY
ncbi:hypothetical protein FGO68_gene16451 [Halteria grandinella]|uniref:Uncharacterized protein n=1 Tax=Halteria grandinella TaxID=5974 RepID=A0A8J8SWI4_HALGN|nr:hypothetical protein FGO68_gene16451 [Halteria grandinella]